MRTIFYTIAAVLCGFALADRLAGDPVVDKAVDEAQKKYPPGDYEHGLSAKDRQSVAHAAFELHAVAARIDATRKWYPLTHSDGSTEKLALEPEILLDQSSIKAAWVEHNSDGEPMVRLKLTGAGGAKFGEVTEKLLNKRMGLVFEGRLISAPVIRSPIYAGDLILSPDDEMAAWEIAAKLSPPASR